MEAAHAFAVELVGRNIRERGMTGVELQVAPVAQLRIGFRDGGFYRPAQTHRGNGLLKSHFFAHALWVYIRKKTGIFNHRLTLARWRYHHARHVLRRCSGLNNQCRHDNLGK
ncbi:hypothetical protein D3C81_1559240 [compost metagenome]